MNLYTHYSDSHKIMYNDYFLSSLRKIYSKSELNLRTLYHEQTTAEGRFMSPGWHEAMDYKILVILKAIEECKGSWFIFSDCDVQFFAPFLNDIEVEIKDKDIVCQEDRGTLCAGFFACQASDKMKEVWETVRARFRSLTNDQNALNCFKLRFNSSTLDKYKFFTVGNFFNNSSGTFVWDNVSNIVPPKNILVHHANYVEGTENKIKLLEMVKNNFKNV